MEVYECLRRRRTVRRFKPVQVPDDVVAKLLRAARWAPSSRDQQPWHLVVVRDRQTLAQMGGIASSAAFLAEAPVAIALVMEDSDAPELDAGRALQQMEIMAWSEGMGTCFVGLSPDQRDKIAELLGIPPTMDLITVLPFGYRTDDFKGRGAPRKPLADMAHSERFGNAYVAA